MNLLDLMVNIGVKDEASGAVDDVSQGIVSKLTGAAKTAAKALAGAFAVKKVVDFGKAAFDAYSEFEQLAGGAEKIFDEVDQSKILSDANDAWKTLNMSANEYMAAINQTGAMFAQTMGDEKGYETAKTGMQAISDYATGTGRDINELNTKFSMITRSTSSYQSIADQFAGILPATSADFLEQAKAAGVLSGSYEKLTDVPVAEYQEAVTKMLEKGVDDLGLANNTANESLSTLSGSMLATKSAWQNLVAEFGKPDSDIGARISDMFTAVMGENGEGGLLRNVTGEVTTIATNMVNAAGQALEIGVDYIRDNGPKLLESAMLSVGDALERAWDKVLDFRTDFNLVDAMFGEDGESGIVGKVGDWLGRMGQAISDNWPYIEDQLGMLWDELVAAAETFGPQIIEVAGRLVTMAGDAISKHGPGVAAKVSQLLQDGLNAVGRLVGMAAAKGAEFVGGIITGTSEEGKNLRKWFADFFPDGLLKGLGDFATFLLDAGKALINGLLDGIGEVAPDVEQAIRDAFDTVLDWFGKVGDFLKDPIGTIEDGLKGLRDGMDETAQNIDSNTGRAEQSIGQLNKTKLRDKKATATVKGNAVDGSAKKSVKDTDDAVQKMRGKDVTVTVNQRGMNKSMVDGLRDAIGKLRDKSVTLTTNQTTVKRTKVVEEPKARGGIRRHARGDIFVADNYGPGVPLDIVGERGPEAIVPLTSHYGKDFAEMMGEAAAKVMGGGGPTVNIYMTYNAGEDATKLVGDIADGLQLVLGGK